MIGLRVAGLNPERFARIAVANGALPALPAGFKPFPAVENPNQIENIKAPYAKIPAQQPLFYNGCQLQVPVDPNYFASWMKYAMKSPAFRPSETVEANTCLDIPDAEAAAYDAPFPNRTYMAGVRKFPSLVNELGGTTDGAWVGLRAFNRPFLTLWATNEPGNLGSCAAQQTFVEAVPGAKGQPHDRLPNASHFIQDDQGPELAKRLVTFFSK